MIMTKKRRAAQSAVRLAQTFIILTCCTAFGALGANPVPAISRTEVVEALSRGVAEFQSFMGINRTGANDVETANSMTKKRCGVSDKVGPDSGNSPKEYTLMGTKWDHRSLTYKITKYSSKLDAATIDREIARAFAVWSNYVDLTFTPKSGQVDIEISFVRGWHGDQSPFDGPGFPGQSNTLAHAFSPGHGGDVHFDDYEWWTVNCTGGVDLFRVAVHEFGHALGLDHSNVSSSIMYPYMKDHTPHPILDSDDIAGIQALYGAKTDNNPRDEDTQICAFTKIDTVLITSDYRYYPFKGKYYWKFFRAEMAAGYPKLITETWIGLPSNIDGAFEYDGWTHFFKGSKYWAYSSRGQLKEGHPKEISQAFTGIPNDIDAVIGPFRTDVIVFHKGGTFWTYNLITNSRVRTTGPELTSNWLGQGSELPENFDGAFIYGTSFYYFKNDVYYRFNGETFLMDAESPRKIAPDWFSC